MTKAKPCRECGCDFTAARSTGVYCSGDCRKTFNNRRMLRGAEFYDLFMAQRFDRAAADAEGAWQLMSRMAAHYRAQDERTRAGRRSWSTIREVKDRNPFLLATVVANNVLGAKR